MPRRAHHLTFCQWMGSSRGPVRREGPVLTEPLLTALMTTHRHIERDLGQENRPSRSNIVFSVDLPQSRLSREEMGLARSKVGSARPKPGWALPRFGSVPPRVGGQIGKRGARIDRVWEGGSTKSGVGSANSVLGSTKSGFGSTKIRLRSTALGLGSARTGGSGRPMVGKRIRAGARNAKVGCGRRTRIRVGARANVGLGSAEAGVGPTAWASDRLRPRVWVHRDGHRFDRR